MKKLLFAFLLAFSTLAYPQSYREIEIVPSAARTVTGAGSAVDTIPGQLRYESPGVLVLVNVTAVSGTSPTMTFSLQGVVNGLPYTLGSCTAITAVNTCALVIANAPASVRGSWTIAGTTPSFTFSAVVVRQ